MSPVASVRMQDSLELLIDSHHPRREPDDLLSFHEHRGRNVELSAERTVARRVASYNQGIVFVQPPVRPGGTVEVVLEQVDERWRSSIMVGLVWGAPERISLPVTALGLKVGVMCGMITRLLVF